MRILSLFFYLDRAIAHLERSIAILCLIGLSAILIAQIIFRYVFRQPIFWAEEFALSLMVLMTFVGLSLLIHSGKLVALTPLNAYLSRKTKIFISLFVKLVVVFITAFLAYFTFKFISNVYVWAEQSPTLHIPRASYYAMFGVECSFMCLHQIAVIFGGKSILDLPTKILKQQEVKN